MIEIIVVALSQCQNGPFKWSEQGAINPNVKSDPSHCLVNMWLMKVNWWWKSGTLLYFDHFVGPAPLYFCHLPHCDFNQWSRQQCSQRESEAHLDALLISVALLLIFMLIKHLLIIIFNIKTIINKLLNYEGVKLKVRKTWCGWFYLQDPHL